MSKSRLQRAVAREALSVALNQPITLAHDVNTIEPRHLLRALLRQSSYLPDARARLHFYNYVVGRYRKYYPRQPKPSNGPTLTPFRRRSLLKEARKGLLFLTRANDGHPDHLLRVLAMTYGRTGAKRHELLKTVVSPSNFKTDHSPRVPADEQDLARLSALITADSVTGKLPDVLISRHRYNPLQGHEKLHSAEGPLLGSRLEALVISQRAKSPARFQRPQVGKAQPSIPEKNSWGRPMPQKRISNIKAKWYAKILDRVMPPLPEPEWYRLRDLALGIAPWEGLVKRRTRLTQNKVGNCRSDESQSHIEGDPVPAYKEILRMESRDLLGSHPHKLTPRYMRHLWGKIFLQCPMMQWDPISCRWNVIWGSLERSIDVVLGQPGQINLDVFKGVDDNGKLTSPNSACLQT